MSFLLLTVAFVLTGFNLILNKAVIELGLGSYIYLYMIGFWGIGVIAGIAVRGFSRHGCTKTDLTVGVAMGIAGAIAMITFMLAIERLSGVVVFPVRSCGNILLTASLSYLLWRERLSQVQWLGIVCAAVAVYLLL